MDADDYELGEDIHAYHFTNILSAVLDYCKL